MTKLVKSKNNKPSVQPVEEKFTVKAGDIFLSERETAIRIIERQKGKYDNYTYEWLYDVLNGGWKKALSKYSGAEEYHDDTIGKSSLEEYYTKITQQEFDAWVDKARSFMNTGELQPEYQIEENAEDASTALVGSGSKEYLQTLEAGMKERANELQGMQNIISLFMQQKERELNAYKKKLEAQMKVFEKQIERVQRQITVIELYLGINEEMHQIANGTPAGVDEPICFRQQVLFMDEETGIDTDGGLDSTRIDEFDEWLLVNDNYKKIIPENKCVVTFKVRRYQRDYGDKWINAQMDLENREYTYFLIRNGDNLYRIFTNKIIVADRLFPRRNELNEMFDEMSKAIADTPFEHNKEEARDKAELQLYVYKKIAVFYQGLIDRSEVFHPVNPKISIFKMDEFEGSFNFIYDDEIALPTGRMPFWEWHQDINNKLVRGSRVVLSDRRRRDGTKVSRENDEARLKTKMSVFKAPANGIYEVELQYEEKYEVIPHYYIDELEAKGLLIKKDPERVAHFGVGYTEYSTNEYLPLNRDIKILTFKQRHEFIRSEINEYIEAYKCKFKQEVFFIRYAPKDTVYAGWGDDETEPHERKNRISWRIDRNDDFIFNYDQIDTDSIRFYLGSRADRRNYFQMLPMLKRVLKIREDELKWERGFVKLMVDNAAKKYGHKLDAQACEKFVWGCIEWWKNKVIFKRPITKDDSKALRMIEERILAESNKKIVCK